MKEADPAMYQAIVESVPTGRLFEPQEIAHAALYVVSDDARYAAGTVIIVDGGYAAPDNLPLRRH